jgi:acyl-CoA reductase-like NAD-dependent aldehyde dehydrogenase
VASARAALRAGGWPAWQRAEVLDRAATLLAEPKRAETFARTIAAEAAKPISSARLEVARASQTMRFSAGVCRSLAGEGLALDAAPAGEGRLGFTMRVPVGVVAAITPFNFPLNLVAHKLGPAIAAGCPVVLKPAPQTPLTALLFADLLIDDAGLEPERLHVLTGGSVEIGAALVAHDDVAMVTFTGSPEVGWRIRAAAPRKRVALELGNNAPVVVAADADIDRAARRIAETGFSHAGQSCISVQRVYVDRRVADDFLERLVAAAGDLVVGDPLDERTDVSALIDVPSRDRVLAWVEEARTMGARVACGGTVDADGVLGPTVLVGAPEHARVCKDEVFGPVVTVNVVDDVDTALRLAGGGRFGLQAGVFTSDLGIARRAITDLDVGGVIINDVPTWRVEQMPYGGMRDSGNTREGPASAVLEMTEVRVVVIA